MIFPSKGPVGFTSKGNRAGDTQIVQMKGRNIFFKHNFLCVTAWIARMTDAWAQEKSIQTPSRIISARNSCSCVMVVAKQHDAFFCLFIKTPLGKNFVPLTADRRYERSEHFCTSRFMRESVSVSTVLRKSSRLTQERAGELLKYKTYRGEACLF